MFPIFLMMGSNITGPKPKRRFAPSQNHKDRRSFQDLCSWGLYLHCVDMLQTWREQETESQKMNANKMHQQGAKEAGEGVRISPSFVLFIALTTTVTLANLLSGLSAGGRESDRNARESRWVDGE